MRSECDDLILEDMLTQTLNGQSVATDVHVLEKTIDAITQTDVQQVFFVFLINKIKSFFLFSWQRRSLINQQWLQLVIYRRHRIWMS
jgi:hypothetical protein